MKCDHGPCKWPEEGIERDCSNHCADEPSSSGRQRGGCGCGHPDCASGESRL